MSSGWYLGNNETDYDVVTSQIVSSSLGGNGKLLKSLCCPNPYSNEAHCWNLQWSHIIMELYSTPPTQQLLDNYRHIATQEMCLPPGARHRFALRVVRCIRMVKGWSIILTKFALCNPNGVQVSNVKKHAPLQLFVVFVCPIATTTTTTSTKLYNSLCFLIQCLKCSLTGYFRFIL